MATFELNNEMLNTSAKHGAASGKGERFERETRPASVNPAENSEGVSAAAFAPIKSESVIALKIYDSCRQQDCLDDDDLGSARSACEQYIGCRHYKEGEIIVAPENSASVSVDDLRIKKIIIVNKRHNPFKRGFWDIDLKFVFEYTLTFRSASGSESGKLRAINIFNKTVTLFGSVGSDIVIATDLLSDMSDESPTLGMDPFVLVEAKAVALSAKLKWCRYSRDDEDEGRPAEIAVTIGLFTMVKLYRIVTLLVESRGFSIPRHCEQFSPINVCDFFDRLPFPMDVFAPPQRKEFEAGISGDIFDERGEGCGCDQKEASEA